MVYSYCSPSDLCNWDNSDKFSEFDISTYLGLIFTETERLIRQALDRLIEGRTTFIITHRLPIIKNADLILMLDKGEIAEMGKHPELMAKEGLYYHIYQSQLMSQENGNSTEEK